MSFFHAFIQGRHHHHHGHRHGHHHHGHHHGEGFGKASRLDHLADKVARRLDLNEDQQAKLATLLTSLQAQREAVRGDTLVQDVQGLMSGTTLDRQAAQALLDARVAAVQSAAPTLIAALADFYDALDAEQQQVLRFIVRLGKRARGARGHSEQ